MCLMPERCLMYWPAQGKTFCEIVVCPDSRTNQSLEVFRQVTRNMLPEKH